jgi:hypothetical protein
MYRNKTKKEYICSVCQKKYLRWVGFCSGCKKGGTVQEHIVIVPPSTATPSQRSLARRAKQSERDIGKRMLDADGPDPMFSKIASSTGRVGHITALRFDTVSRTYATENKNRKMPTWLIQAWVLIQQRAHDFNKNALLHIEPPNMPKEFTVNGMKYKTGNMAIITQERHEELIHHEQALAAVIEILQEEKTSLNDKVSRVTKYLLTSDHLKK